MAGTFVSLLKRNTTLLRPGLLCQACVYGANVIGLSYYLKHSFFLKQFRGYSERHRAYGPDEPADELLDMVNDVISKDLKDMASENTPIAMFLNPGMKTTHLGTVGTNTGGFVGVPVFYEYKDEEDVKDNILVKSVNYDAANIKENDLNNCFILSDRAKRYGIAREILLVNTLQVYINAGLPLVTSLIVVFFYSQFQETYRVLKRPLYVRSLAYTCFILVGLGFWRFLYKNVLYYYESEVEAKISQLGSDYLEGGIEYCSKELVRDALLVEVKDEKLRPLKYIDDFISKLVPTGVSVSKRLEYLKAYVKSKEENV